MRGLWPLAAAAAVGLPSPAAGSVILLRAARLTAGGRFGRPRAVTLRHSGRGLAGDYESQPSKSSSSVAQPGRVYFVSTPIGNLEDMTLRGLNVLRTVDVLAAEDTRVAGRLLQLLGVDRGNMTMISHHEHNAVDASKKIVEKASSGYSVAVISDAGTPGISDPGALLAAACAESGIPVVPVPGACAAAAAMSVSGFGSVSQPKWTFHGFIPSKGTERNRRLADIVRDEAPCVLYEAPHRIVRTLLDLIEAAPPGLERESMESRRVLCAREITKHHEELFRGTLASAVAHYGEGGDGTVKGEFTVVLGPLVSIEPSEEDLKEEVVARFLQLRGEGTSTSSAVKSVASAMGLRKSFVYGIALEVEKDVERG